MKFEKGHKKVGGRQKGSSNKLTVTFKELLTSAIAEMQDDPKVNLAAWGKANPTEFYKIAAKLIPTEVMGAGEDGAIIVRFKDAS